MPFTRLPVGLSVSWSLDIPMHLFPDCPPGQWSGTLWRQRRYYVTWASGDV